jgi:hypothetical protein
MTASRDAVDIQIKDLQTHQLQGLQTGLLERFSGSHSHRIAIAVRMPPELKPSVQLFVVCQ